MHPGEPRSRSQRSPGSPHSRRTLGCVRTMSHEPQRGSTYQPGGRCLSRIPGAPIGSSPGRLESQAADRCSGMAVERSQHTTRELGQLEGDRDRLLMCAARTDVLEEIVAFVIDQDEGGEVHDFDLPDRFHPSSSNSTTSTLRMFSLARIAAGPPILPR